MRVQRIKLQSLITMNAAMRVTVLDVSILDSVG